MRRQILVLTAGYCKDEMHGYWCIRDCETIQRGAHQTDRHYPEQITIDRCTLRRHSVGREGKVLTLICGTPRGAGGMPVSSNLPSRLLSLVRVRSPSYTWIMTAAAQRTNSCSPRIGKLIDDIQSRYKQSSLSPTRWDLMQLTP